jgi:hypothetical protein
LQAEVVAVMAIAVEEMVVVAVLAEAEEDLTEGFAHLADPAIVVCQVGAVDSRTFARPTELRALLEDIGAVATTAFRVLL